RRNECVRPRQKLFDAGVYARPFARTPARTRLGFGAQRGERITPDCNALLYIEGIRRRCGCSRLGLRCCGVGLAVKLPVTRIIGRLEEEGGALLVQRLGANIAAEVVADQVDFPVVDLAPHARMVGLWTENLEPGLVSCRCFAEARLFGCCSFLACGGF